MIRIDLGKEDLQGGKRSGAKKDFLAGLKLPPKVQKRLKKLTSDLGMLISVGVAFAIAALFPIVEGQIQTQKINQHKEVVKANKDKVDMFVAEIAKSGPIQRELESYEQQKKVVSDRLGVVRELLDQRATPINVLDTIGQSLPSRTWISNVDFLIQGETSSVNVIGTAYSNEEISDFVDKLSESIYLSDISLDDVGVKTEDKTEFKTFTLTAKPKIKLVATTPAVEKTGEVAAKPK